MIEYACFVRFSIRKTNILIEYLYRPVPPATKGVAHPVSGQLQRQGGANWGINESESESGNQIYAMAKVS